MRYPAVRRMRPLSERFWEKVAIGGPTECWPWLASVKNALGYGQFYFRGRNDCAHRAAYELAVGPIPEGLEIDHLCRNPSCVNPAHLEPVTHRVNTLRGHTAASINAAKTHCPNGHEYIESNTRLSVKGSRICRTCDLDRKREAYRMYVNREHPNPTAPGPLP